MGQNLRLREDRSELIACLPTSLTHSPSIYSLLFRARYCAGNVSQVDNPLENKPFEQEKGNWQERNTERDENL